MCTPKYAFAMIVPFLLFVVIGCCPPASTVAADQEPSRDEASKPLHELFDEAYQHHMEQDPLRATSVGIHAYNDRLPPDSLADHQTRLTAMKEFMARAKAVDRDALGDQDRISLEIFVFDLNNKITEIEDGHHLMDLTVDSGFHIEFAAIPNRMPFYNEKDYENYISRLMSFPTYTAQRIELLTEGLRRGMTLPKVALQGYEGTISAHLVDDPTKSLFYKPFTRFPVGVPPDRQAQLIKAGEKAIVEGAIAGYRAFYDFMVNTYMPGARETLGASDMPNGKKYYANRVIKFTTIDWSPEKIHQIGLDEVKRIRGEMEQIIEGLEFEGEFADFLLFLRTDPRFYAKTPEELLQKASYHAKRMDAQLPALFKTLPRLPYGVAPVPDHLAPKYTGGRYVGPARGSTEPGYYWVNTYDLKSRPLYILEALSLHEAVPGHHLQISLARELEGLPKFRQGLYISAFGEGWGLYSEWLGIEAGFYQDPYSDFGRLTYEMWRACRLVVDTGVHAMGWTRDQMLEYLGSNTALSLHEVKTETDRYISWPAQALSYKIGDLKIKELRKMAERELAGDFDVRDFHDAVLRNGSLPLSILESEIKRFIEEVKAEKQDKSTLGQ